MVKPFSTRSADILATDSREDAQEKIRACILRSQIEECVECERIGLYQAQGALENSILVWLGLCGGMVGTW
jgi:hypothetical protein